jgi:hypothetical protein
LTIYLIKKIIDFEYINFVNYDGYILLMLQTKLMKKYLIVSFILSLAIGVSGQSGFGFDVGVGSSKAPMIAVKYYFEKNAISLGGSYTVFNNALGKEKELIPGDPAIGDGWVFYTIDIGYTRVLNEKFSIEGEISFGKKKHYQNISNNDFSSGGYHRFIDEKSIAGGGGLLFYNINQTVGLFAGYNSIREGTFGVEIRFFHEKQY